MPGQRVLTDTLISPPWTQAVGASERGRKMMTRTFGRLCGVAVMFAALLVLAGCGSSDKSSSSSDKSASSGGTLTMLTNGDVDDKLDPGYSYYQLDFIYTNSTQRAVLGNKPEDTTKASPDFA